MSIEAGKAPAAPKLPALLAKAKSEGWWEWIRGPSDERAILDGCTFDISRPNFVAKWFQRNLRHSKGIWAGKPFVLLDWQWRDLIGPLFGWVRPNGTRRFRRAYWEVAKKNGKSTLLSAIGLFMLMADGEQGAEIYSAALDQIQAGIIFKEAANMVGQSPALSARLLVNNTTKYIGHPQTRSWFRALSAVVDQKEGINGHCVLFDELHVQKRRDFYDALAGAGIARKQPLNIGITTAGVDRTSICWEERQYAKQVIDGNLPDWTLLPFIASADEKDDWTDQKTWAKANPSLGQTIDVQEMAEACAKARRSPAAENSFRRYRLNQWLHQETRWLKMEDWDNCGKAFDVAELDGQVCFAGLDLSSTSDLCAWCLLFPREDGRWRALWRFWCPEDRMDERAHRDGALYRTWSRSGLLHPTSGVFKRVVDYEALRADIRLDQARYAIKEVAIDRWNAGEMMTHLAGDGLTVVPFGQGYFSMNPPCKELERLVITGLIEHGGNELARWMCSNVAALQDAAGNIKLDKASSKGRIDGMVALVMALGRAIAQPAETASVYETRGIRDLNPVPPKPGEAATTGPAVSMYESEGIRGI